MIYSRVYFQGQRRERKCYYKNEEYKILHRDDGPAVEYKLGDKEWFVNGVKHRTDGPAVECRNGAREWWVNGQRHREDGPARIYYSTFVDYSNYKNGFLSDETIETKEYWLYYKKYEEEEYWALIRFINFV